MMPDYNSGYDPYGYGGGYSGGGYSAPAAPAAPSAPQTSGSQIQSWYQKYLGHDMGAGTDEQKNIWGQWANMDPNAVEQGIKNSTEAAAWTASQNAPKPAPAAAPAAEPARPALAQPSFANYSGGAPPIASAQGANPALGQLRSLLMQKATQSEAPDMNDPTINAQTDAYAADMTRAGRSFLSQQAESAGPISNMDAAYRSAGEKVGQATANYRGKLLQGMVDSRRKQIGEALNGLGGTLSTDEGTRLRQEDQDLERQRFGAGTAQQAFDDQYKTIFG